MKKTILFLFITFSISCCKEDDTSLVCLSDCTVVQGQIVTSAGEPLVNIPLEFRHNSSRPYSSSIRRIKKATTDKNGYYSMEFFIESDELGLGAKGHFELVIDYSRLNGEIYMNNSPFYDINISSINRRDTTIIMDFYNPKKAYITVNLNGFNPMSDTDAFTVRSFYPTGLKIGQNSLLDTEYQIAQGTEIKASSVNTVSDSVLVALSELNRIGVDRHKNGEKLETEYFTVYVPDNNNITLNYSF
jgi:hypothetical protein